MTYTQQGRLIKMTGGLYTVRLDPSDNRETAPLAGKIVECRARGQFRHTGITPLVGDRVTVQYDDTSYATGADGRIYPSAARTGLLLADILPRKNSLIRPPLANVDILLCVIAAASPDPDIPTVDKLLSILEFNHIEPVILVTKCELHPTRAEKIRQKYGRVGYRVFVLSSCTGEGMETFSDFVRTDLPGKITAVAGASGAGKSTLLNRLFPGLRLETGNLSEKIGRGKNTTRHTELFDLADIVPPDQAAASGSVVAGGYIADTAGFSLLDFERFDFFSLEDLPHTFREFRPYLGGCRYTDCTHTTDEGCAVLEAVAAKKIGKSRHAAYCELYEILKEKKKW